MFDLLAVAYQADLTRVFTFMMAREASQRTYPALGIAEDAPRRVASRRPGPDKMAQHAKINTHFTDAVRRRSSSKLRKSPDGDGSVLDHSLIVFGARHERRPGAQRPIRCRWPRSAARAASIKGNRFVVAPEWTPVANLWLERRRDVRQPDRAVRREQRAGSSSDATALRARLWRASAVRGCATARRRLPRGVADGATPLIDAVKSGDRGGRARAAAAEGRRERRRRRRHHRAALGRAQPTTSRLTRLLLARRRRRARGQPLRRDAAAAGGGQRRRRRSPRRCSRRAPIRTPCCPRARPC